MIASPKFPLKKKPKKTLNLPRKKKEEGENPPIFFKLPVRVSKIKRCFLKLMHTIKSIINMPVPNVHPKNIFNKNTFKKDEKKFNFVIFLSLTPPKNQKFHLGVKKY
jgi:hypothetical protein